MVEIGPEGIEGLTARLRFIAPEEPLVSVIVPAFNQIEYTVRCLASLHQHPPEVSYELIVVDDASSDATERLLSHMPGLRYLRNPENLGFCAPPTGARLRRGAIICCS